MPKFFKRIIDSINSLKTQKKLLAIFFITGVLPMLCLGVFLIANTRGLILQQHTTQLESENKRVRIVLFDATYLASNLSEILFFDKQLKAIAAKKYADPSEVYAAYRNYAMIDTYMSNYTELSAITVYVSNETMIPYGHFQLITDQIRSAGWYREAASSSGENLWIVDTALAKDGSLHLVRKIPTNDSGNFAILMISISNNFLKLMINDSSLYSLAALEDGHVFYSDSNGEVGNPLAIETGRTGAQPPWTGKAGYQGEETYYSGSFLTPVNASDTIQIITVDRDAIRRANEVTAVISVIVAIAMIVPYAIIILFSGNFSRRIITLRREMHKVAGGDFNIIDKFNGKDELSDVFADMKTMIDCIQNLYKEIYSEKLTSERLANRQQLIELELLSSQINPHFLFNTLESIRMNAYVNGNREAAQIIKLLGKSIRHVLEVGQAPVPLASELDSIRMYMDIQIFRFKDKITYGINVAGDVDINVYKILPLLLQPIVENSIVHGLEDKEDRGCMHIDIRREDETIVIIVSDNGIGMSGEQYEALDKKIHDFDNTQTRESIGLPNVSQRIKLFYGPAYGMNITSRQNEGTVVTLRLPADGRGVTSREGINC